MTRRYEDIWKAIKQAPVGKAVQVKVHASAARVLKLGVQKEKSRETAPRKQLGLRYAGKLQITEIHEDANGNPVQPKGYVIVEFKLSWDGTRL